MFLFKRPYLCNILQQLILYILCANSYINNMEKGKTWESHRPCKEFKSTAIVKNKFVITFRSFFASANCDQRLEMREGCHCKENNIQCMCYRISCPKTTALILIRKVGQARYICYQQMDGLS